MDTANVTDKVTKSYFKNIDNIYIKADFFKRYGIDVFLTIIIIIIMISLIIYFNILNNLQKLRANWNTEKCNPFYMPFASIINPNPNKTPEQQISDNIHDCIIEGIKGATVGATKSFYSQLNVFLNVKNEFFTSMSFISEMFNTLFNLINTVIRIFLEFINKLILGFSNVFIKFKSSLEKIVGILAIVLYMLQELYNMGLAFALNLGTISAVTLITPLAVTLAAEFAFIVTGCIAIAIFGSICAIPVFGWPFCPVVVSYSFAEIIMILVIIITVIMLIIATIVTIALLTIQDAIHKKIAKP